MHIHLLFSLFLLPTSFYLCATGLDSKLLCLSFLGLGAWEGPSIRVVVTPPVEPHSQPSPSKKWSRNKHITCSWPFWVLFLAFSQPALPPSPTSASGDGHPHWCQEVVGLGDSKTGSCPRSWSWASLGHRLGSGSG